MNPEMANSNANNNEQTGEGTGGSDGRRSQAQRAEETRRALIAAGRELFAERGYDDVGAEEIVRTAGLTRGALYHHFPSGKPALLEAIYERLEAESTERVAHIVLDSEMHSPLAAMKAGVAAFLDECAEPGFQRIVLHDAPAVLGWDRWREVSAANGLGLIEASLIAAIEAGEIRPLPVKPTAHLLLGALDEAAMLQARSSDPAGRAEITSVLLALIDSFAAPLPG
jgi:AcrR family transcriptional regulator